MEVTVDVVNGVVVSEAVYQDEGECDPDSKLPCRCPRRELVYPPVEFPFSATEVGGLDQGILFHQCLLEVLETRNALYRGPPYEAAY